MFAEESQNLLEWSLLQRAIEGGMRYRMALGCLACWLCAGGVLRAEITEEAAQLFNHDLHALRELLQKKFSAARMVAERGGADEDYRALAEEVQELRRAIRHLEEGWNAHAGEGQEESSALWDLGETTLAQLLMEYGSADFLYLIPPELAGMKISLFSGLPIPRESWDELIALLLVQNGVGVRLINAYAKQLYILKADPTLVEGITSHEEELRVFPNHARLCHVFSPFPEQVKSIHSFFERFIDPKQTFIQAMGSKLILLSTKETIEKLLQLYHVVWEREQGRTVRWVSSPKLSSQEAEKVLKAVFADSMTKGRPALYALNGEELMTLALPQGLVLIGEKELVDRGEKILADLEGQLEDPEEKVIFWYACKHSDPEDIARVLEKVYDSLVGSNFEKTSPPLPPSAPLESGGAPLMGEKGKKLGSTHFIVDPKTVSLLMVVRREELGKIKSLLKRLDAPKKMVQLDVLLVEKKIQDRSQVGMNLLRLGDAASQKSTSSVAFDASDRAVDKGILNFLMSRSVGSISPAFDLTYHFLMAQEDLQINANPSVLAVNQTVATISVVEEISINNGAVQMDKTGGASLEKSFTRAQYGTKISLTPTIYLPEEGEEDHGGFVSLQTDIAFETTEASKEDRPPVTRRHIVNEVRIGDGETVILGGLRRKSEGASREKIPFLGDLPGLGKLFGLTKSSESHTEMFIFITPHIIRDPVEDLRRLRKLECQKRPGDIPEFLERLEEAKLKGQKKLFENSFDTLMRMYTPSV